MKIFIKRSLPKKNFLRNIEKLEEDQESMQKREG